MRFHIKSLGMTKTQGFSQDLYGHDLFCTIKNYMSTSAVFSST